MAFLRRSLSEECIDGYSHTWVFLFLLVLSIVTLFVSMNTPMTARQSQLPDYTAQCWTPAHFPGPYTLYTNKVCASAMNKAVRGENSSSAMVYNVMGDDPIHVEMKPKRVAFGLKDNFQPSSDNVNSTKGSEDQKDSKGNDEEQNDFQTDNKSHRHGSKQAHDDLQNLINYKTPICLFLFAICLLLPHAVCSMLSGCCGSINVDQTLASAQAALSAGASGWQGMKEDIALNLEKSAKRSAGLLYLLMKLLMTLVLCVEVIAVGHFLLAEVDALENGVSDARMIRQRSMSSAAHGGNKRGYDADTDLTAYYDVPDGIYICEFNISQFMTIHKFSVQCLFSKESSEGADQHASKQRMTGGSGDNKSSLSLSSSEDEEDRILLLYKALFTMVLALLVILAVLNIISLVAWLLRLNLATCKSYVGLTSDAPLDVVFLVSMAWHNTSAIVAMELAKCSPRFNSASGEGESMRLKDDVCT